VIVLFAVNFVGGLIYFASLEGKLVLAALVGSFFVIRPLYKSKGFVRLLGVSHVFWLALVPWLFVRYMDTPDGVFRFWLLAVMVVNSISLIIDIVDVIRYARGERAPIVTPSE